MLILRKLADALIYASATISAGALITVMCVICADVIGRAIGAPVYGAHDIVTMVMVIIVFGAMPLCDRLGGHVAVDVLQNKFSATVNNVIDILVSMVGALFFAFVCYATWESAKISNMLNLSTNLLSLEKAWFQYFICFFCVVSSLGLTARTIELSIFGHDVRNVKRDK